MNGSDFSIVELSKSLEAKDNNKKIRIDYENLKSVNLNLINLLGDNIDYFVNTIKYAYKVLINNFKIWMDNCYDIEQLFRLQNIFNNFTKLRSELHTSGIKNKDLKAYALYGLHVTNIIRGQHNIAMINIFNIFIVSPRTARYDLCYDMYKYYFYPLISEVLKTELINMSKNQHNEEGKENSIQKMRDASDLRRYKLEEIEQKIDDLCICYAEEALQEFGCTGDIL